MRPFPKELFSRIPAKAISHSGIFALFSGNTTLHFGFTGTDETVKSCVDRAIEGELTLTNAVTGIDTIIDTDLITHIGFVVVKSLGKSNLAAKKSRAVHSNRLSNTDITKKLPWRISDFKHRSN